MLVQVFGRERDALFDVVGAVRRVSHEDVVRGNLAAFAHGVEIFVLVDDVWKAERRERSSGSPRAVVRVVNHQRLGRLTQG